MKLSTYPWNVRVTINGKSGVVCYYGYQKKVHAEAIALQWRAAGYTAEVIKY